MLVTMLEGELDEEQGRVLVEHFADDGEGLPPPILESFVIRDTGSDAWRIVTVWRSREALESYLSSVETPGGGS